MGKLRKWLIRLLGGYTQRDMNFKDAKIEALNLGCSRVVMERRFFIRPGEDRQAQRKKQREIMAWLLAQKMIAEGMIGFEKILMPVQPCGPVSAYRLRATVYARDWREKEDETDARRKRGEGEAGTDEA